MTTPDPRRLLPQVDALARSSADMASPSRVRDAARRVIEAARQEMVSGGREVPELAELHSALRDDLLAHRPLTEILNATGVLLHTNLGRAPIAVEGSPPAIAVDLEFDAATGERGRRLGGLERSLCALTGAEAALVVNNNAAAVLLAVSALAAGREVIVARGELVEIGGSFRIPDVIVQGGARLREVGTTNCVHPSDLQNALGGETALMLEVHPSNYRVVGYTSSVSTRERAEISSGGGVPLLVDAGSGLLDARCPWLNDGPPAWLVEEPGVRQLLDDGADLVAFSGDKLLGGPQSGILVGSTSLMDTIRAHPLARALRYDKTRAAYLESTLDTYLDGTAGDEIPFWIMATITIEELTRRAGLLAAAVSDLAAAEVQPAVGAVGAGCLATADIPDVMVSVAASSPDRLMKELRRGTPTVVAVTGHDSVRFHLRSIRAADDERLAQAVREAIRGAIEQP